LNRINSQTKKLTIIIKPRTQSHNTLSSQAIQHQLHSDPQLRNKIRKIYFFTTANRYTDETNIFYANPHIIHASNTPDIANNFIHAAHYIPQTTYEGNLNERENIIEHKRAKDLRAYILLELRSAVSPQNIPDQNI